MAKDKGDVADGPLPETTNFNELWEADELPGG